MFAAPSRRALLRLLPAAAAPAVLAASAPRRTFLLDFAIAGAPYHGYRAVADALAVRQKLALRREPSNPHDPLAIEVLTDDGVKLGYVPRAANAALARLLDDGRTMEAEIASFLGEDVARRIREGLACTSVSAGEPRIAVHLVEVVPA